MIPRFCLLSSLLANGRGRNPLRHQRKSSVPNGGAGGFASPVRLRTFFSRGLTLLSIAAVAGAIQPFVAEATQ
jgi:hypothetical protein